MFGSGFRFGNLCPRSRFEDVADILECLVFFLPAFARPGGRTDEGRLGCECVRGDLALARLVEVDVSVFWESVVGEVANGLDGFGFDGLKVGRGGAELADIGEARGRTYVV